MEKTGRHIGTWLKLIQYHHLTVGEGWLRSDWSEEFLLVNVGLSFSDLRDEHGVSLCRDLWDFKHKNIEIKHFEYDSESETAFCDNLEARLSCEAYKSRRKEANKIISNQSLRRAVKDKSGGLCVYCNSNENICIDHIHPVKHGGSNDIDNLQALCRSCNSSKGAKVEL